MKKVFIRPRRSRVILGMGPVLALFIALPAHAVQGETDSNCSASSLDMPESHWTVSPLRATLTLTANEVMVTDARLLVRKTEIGWLRCVDVKLSHPPDHNLLHRDHDVGEDFQGSRLTLSLERLEQAEPLTLVKGNGTTTFATLLLQSPSHHEIPTERPPPTKRLSFGMALAPISFSESQARDNSYASLNLRFEIEGELSLNAGGSTRLQASADAAALILEQYGNDDLRSLRAGARIVQRLFETSSGLRISMGVGPHFQTMLVPSDRFGFRNFAGPQASTHFEYGLKSGGQLSAVVQLGLDGGFRSLPTLTTTEWTTRFSYHTGTLAPGTQTAWPSEISYQFSSLSGLLHGIQMTGESHALGGRWRLDH